MLKKILTIFSVICVLLSAGQKAYAFEETEIEIYVSSNTDMTVVLESTDGFGIHEETDLKADEEGVIKVSFDQPGEYKLAAYGTDLPADKRELVIQVVADGEYLNGSVILGSEGEKEEKLYFERELPTETEIETDTEPLSETLTETETEEQTFDAPPKSPPDNGTNSPTGDPFSPGGVIGIIITAMIMLASAAAIKNHKRGKRLEE